MKEIFLTQGQVALVDDNMFEELNQFKWQVRKHGKTFYAQRSSSQINDKRYTIHMHHEILGKPPKGFEVDHENGNGLWNLKNNLRFVTHRENCQNRKNQKTSSRFPGIHWDKSRKKWMAKIQINGIYKNLGRFVDEYEAFAAYKYVVNVIGEKVIGDL